MLFYLQLGGAIDNFYSVTYALLGLTRALFGDVNYEEARPPNRSDHAHH